MAVEEHYGKPQDIEWAVADGKTWLVQSRPITTLHASPDAGATAPSEHKVLVRGLAASTGRASGAVRILTDPSQRDELQAGEVLVAPMTSPDWMSAMRRAAALVTDGGGMTCHAAIVSRELGVPCVVGTRNATTTLRDGEIVTVDGALGQILEGDARAQTPSVATTAPVEVVQSATAPTATRLYANLAFAEHADEVAAMPVDGVGLLRAEFMVADALKGVHPRLLIQSGEQQQFVDAMAESLLRITRAFAPRPGGLPQHRLPLQRVRQPRGRRAVRAARGEPDDRLPGLLPLRPPARPVQPRARRARTGARRRPRTCG